LYSKNITTFIDNLLSKEENELRLEDDIVAATLITKEGQLVNEKAKAWIGGTK